jgi:hypothetical protein
MAAPVTYLVMPCSIFFFVLACWLYGSVWPFLVSFSPLSHQSVATPASPGHIDVASQRALQVDRAGIFRAVRAHLTCCLHTQGSCLLGRTARLPLVADAADQQVPY